MKWYSEVDVPDLDVVFDAHYDRLDSWDLVTYGMGERVMVEMDGREMLVQEFMFYEVSDLPINDFRCVACVWVEPWPSLQSNRVYIVTYIMFDTGSSEVVFDEFYGFMDSFDGNTGD